MGLLDSLNPINLAKSVAESIVDSVLPEGLKAVGNDLVDVALDVVGGNYGGLGKDVGSFLHDAETAMAPLTNLATALPKTTTEPDAPPASTSAPESQTTSGATTATDAQPPSTPPSSTASSITASSNGGADTAAPAAAQAGASAAPTASAAEDTSGSQTDASDTQSTKSKSSSSSSKSKSSSTSSSSSKSKSSSTSDAKDVTKFFAQSDTELMAAVRDGKLPDAVKDDPAAMQRLQLRMNEISEMNQLISQMLAAMHDMNRAVIQNIRA